MTTGSKFRRFFTNTYLEDFDDKEEFSFLTVFNKAQFSYRCCTCAFEHEFIDYIGEDGNLDNSMINKIDKCIENGECTHVQQVTSRMVKKTLIHGAHLAAALGKNDVFINDFTGTTNKRDRRNTTTGIFRLTPCDLAVRKNQSKIALALFNNTTIYGFELCQFMKRDKVQGNVIKIDKISHLEACVCMKNKLLVTGALIYPVDGSTLVKAFTETVSNEMLDVQETFIDYLEWVVNGTTKKSTYIVLEESLIPCAHIAVLYDRPILLDKILKIAATKHLEFLRSDPFLSDVCRVLKRPLCASVLSNNGIVQKPTIIMEAYVCTLIKLLDNCQGTVKSELETALKRLDANIYNQISTRLPYRFSTVSLQTLLNLGANADTVKRESSNVTLFEELWKDDCFSNSTVRKILSMFVYENPDVNIHTRAILNGLSRKNDDYRYNMQYEVPDWYIADTREHGVYGYDDDLLPINFNVPFLIECSFPADKSSMLKSLSNLKLPTTESEYLVKYCEGKYPRSLMVSCRDSLRRHFKGKSLHKYIDMSGSPQKIKDFILMKSLLYPYYNIWTEPDALL